MVKNYFCFHIKSDCPEAVRRGSRVLLDEVDSITEKLIDSLVVCVIV